MRERNKMKNDPRSCERNLRNCVRRLKKNFRTALAIPVGCSNQMSYEATDVGSWSIMCSYVPVKEMKVIDVPRKWNQMKNDPRSYVRNLCNCIRGCIAPVSRGHGFKPHWSPEFCCLFSFQILRGSFFIWFTHFSWLSIKRTLGSGPKGVRLRESES